MRSTKTTRSAASGQFWLTLADEQHVEDTRRRLEEVGVCTDEYCHIRWEEDAPRLSVHNNLLFVLLNILIYAGQIVSEVPLCTSVCAN